MSDEEYKQIEASLIEDLLRRVRKVENDDVKGRVDRLELTMETVQRDLRDMRDEQRNSDAKTEQSFRDLSETIVGLRDQVVKVVNKIALWTGGIIVGSSILGVLFTKTDVLSRILGG